LTSTGTPPSEGERPSGGGPSAGSTSAPAYTGYTLERYHRSIDRLVGQKRTYAVVVVALTAFTAFFFTGAHDPASSLGHWLQWLTIAWLLPIPLLVFSSVVYFLWVRTSRFRIVPRPDGRSPVFRPTVMFQVTSTGVNAGTVVHTLRSVLHWTARHPEVDYRPVVWAVIEEWGYTPNRDQFEPLRAAGVHLIVTPTAYRTARGTTRKGRALQYALDERRRLGLPMEELWVYHQDDETAVGEDTILGIDEFVREHRGEKALGAGIILYPQHAADLRPQQIQEFNRTKDDLRTIFTLTSKHNVFSGFHGSHYLVRADVEDATGWDVGADMTSEDLIFENLVRRDHGPICHLLKGFAYEQAALDWRDQVRQRRRWFQGWWRAVFRQPFSLPRRLGMSYSMIVWMAAIFSLAAMISGWTLGFASLVPAAGALAGFVWATMILGYHQGYLLHREYLPPRQVPLPRVVLNGIVGALLDAVAPWYGVLTPRPSSFQVISKDIRPLPTPAAATPRPIAVASTAGI
jgi:beta-1,4-mannosyltransferase